MGVKQSNWVWKVNAFGKHIRAGSGKRDPFDHERVQKIAKELARQEKNTKKSDALNY